MGNFPGIAVAIAILASVASAQIHDGSRWTDNAGNVCTIDVTQETSTGNLLVTVTDATGFTTNAVVGTATPGSTTAVDAFPATTTQGGTSYRGKSVNGKPRAQRKNAQGEWITLRKLSEPKVKKTKDTIVPEWVTEMSIGPGELGTSLQRH